MVRTEHSKSSFATVLGVSLPIITHITTGRNKPGLDIIQKLLTHFEQISPDWLLLGTGEMYREKPKQKDVGPLVAQINTLFEELNTIQKSQETVIQYHKILFDEIKHLAEMDVLIERDARKLATITQKLEEIKVQLLSE